VGTITVDEGRSVSGQVLDADGRPVAGAKVVAGPRLMGSGTEVGGSGPGLGSAMRHAESDAGGRFVLGGVGPQAIMVVAASTTGRSSVIEVPPGSADAVLTLTLAATQVVEGKVTQAGKPLAKAIVTAQPQSGFRGQFMVNTGEDGRYRYDKLAPDTYQISALKPRGMGAVEMRTRVVTVPPGRAGAAPIQVDIDLPSSDLQLSITVKATDGTVPSAAQVFFIDARVSATIEIELERAIATHGDARYAQGFVMGAAPFVVENLAPGVATVCALSVWGDINDPKVMEALMRDIDNLPVTCQTVEVKARPAAQAVVVLVPPKPAP
jgi:hypothetical protein